MEDDIKVLDRLLNGKSFLSKHPMIDRVWVGPYGKGIEVVLIVNDTKKYWSLQDKIQSSIFDIIDILGIEYNVSVYP